MDKDLHANIGWRLMLGAHFDAARQKPRAWVTALWWRICGKKVRARAQFAPLIAASPRAYNIWLLNEPKPSPTSYNGEPKIIGLVAAGAGQERTITSLKNQGLEVFALGTAATPDISAVFAQINWDVVPWFMPLAAGDILGPNAVTAYQAAAVNAIGNVIYADDDVLLKNGRRTNPHFKPNWNAELFLHFDYLTGSSIVKVEPNDLVDNSETDWASAMVATAVAKSSLTAPPLRLPYILHHRQFRKKPQVPGELKPMNAPFPKVSILVPTRNRVDLLRTCLDGLKKTRYPNLEIIIIDNDSDDPNTLDYLANLDPIHHIILRCPGPFNFSTLNNRAAASATGDLLCLLNNDIEVIEPNWLSTMVQQAMRPEVGAVGAQLLYPDGRIQHAGVILGICGGAAHAHRLIRPEEEGYFQRHSLPQFVSAVTAACLLVRRESFEAVKGLDEKNFAVSFNDVDFCMRLNAKGLQSLYEPRARLIHHESVSRGFDKDPIGAARLAQELCALKAAWKTDAGPNEEIDPFHHPQLNRFSERFVIRL